MYTTRVRSQNCDQTLLKHHLRMGNVTSKFSPQFQALYHLQVSITVSVKSFFLFFFSSSFELQIRQDKESER